MSIENLGNMPICARCVFWEIEPGGLTRNQSNLTDSMPANYDIPLNEAGQDFLNTYGKCRAKYTKGLIALGGLRRRVKPGTLNGFATMGLFVCDSKDDKGNILFQEAEIG